MINLMAGAQTYWVSDTRVAYPDAQKAIPVKYLVSY
jgi:hypothetical protein